MVAWSAHCASSSTSRIGRSDAAAINARAVCATSADAAPDSSEPAPASADPYASRSGRNASSTAANGKQRRPRVLEAAARERPHARGARFRDELDDESRLPDSGVAGEHDDAWASAERLCQPLPKSVELGRAPHDRLGVTGARFHRREVEPDIRRPPGSQ